MNFGIQGGYNVPPIGFWKVENEKLERAFNSARKEAHKNEGGN